MFLVTEKIKISIILVGFLSSWDRDFHILVGYYCVTCAVPFSTINP